MPHITAHKIGLAFGAALIALALWTATCSHFDFCDGPFGRDGAFRRDIGGNTLELVGGPKR